MPLEEPFEQRHALGDVDGVEGRAELYSPRAAAAQVPCGLLQAVALLDHAAGVREKSGAARRQFNPPRRALEKDKAELPLEAADLRRQGGLSHVHPHRRPAEVQLLGDRQEAAQRLQLDMQAAPPAAPS